MAHFLFSFNLTTSQIQHIMKKGDTVTHFHHQAISHPNKNEQRLYQMNKDRYLDFLKFALHRIIETATHFESEAKACHNSTVKVFLYFLAGKKRVQHVILEMIANDNQKSLFAIPANYHRIKDSEIQESVALSQMSIDSVFRFAQNKAEKDVNLYSSLAALEEDINTKKLLLTLANLCKEFLEEITAGYSKFDRTINNFSILENNQI